MLGSSGDLGRVNGLGNDAGSSGGWSGKRWSGRCTGPMTQRRARTGVAADRPFPCLSLAHALATDRWSKALNLSTTTSWYRRTLIWVGLHHALVQVRQPPAAEAMTLCSLR